MIRYAIKNVKRGGGNAPPRGGDKKKPLTAPYIGYSHYLQLLFSETNPS